MRYKQILFALLLSLGPLVSFAADIYTVTTELNVRLGPGKQYPVSFTLKEGDEVEFLSSWGSWYQVRYSGKSGYVYSKYLQFKRKTSPTSLDTQQISELDTKQRKVSYLLTAAYLCLAGYVIFIIYAKLRDNRLLATVTESDRGTGTERDLVLKLLKWGIPAKFIFHDLYVEKTKGVFSQVDLVVVTEVGIIAFEVKNYSGWIFGSGDQSRWTQVLAYGKQKYQFYNPIKQNSRHIAELRKQLFQFNNIPFHSVVVFYGNSVFRQVDFIPDGTFLVKSRRVLDVMATILTENPPVHYTNEDEIIRILSQAVTNGGIIENRIRHSENIMAMKGMHRIFD
ncbi:NERD domain-containing protein [Chryseolinea sp. T2]|uniref:NERD domain-containing protein n=1 Tax=Chryseolinea sp. T2 TaxID=3129255 RepID=UPI0030784D2F